MKEKEIKIIPEKKYQEIKSIMNKRDDYFTEQEFKNLMQFLMQRHEYF